MPLRPETRRRRKALRLPRPPPPAAPPARPAQTEAGGWLVQRCLMATRRNQAHAQVESARGAGRGAPAAPCSPPRGALNRFFTILCMLQYVQAPSPRGTGGRGGLRGARSRTAPPAPALRAADGRRGRRAAEGGDTRQHAESGGGAVGPATRGARGGGGTEADTFRDASNK